MAKEKGPGRIQRIRNAVGRWFEWDLHANNWKYISDRAGRFFVIRRSESKETFDELINRLGLTEQDLLRQKNSFWNIAVINLLLFFLMLSYAIYMAAHFLFPGAYAAFAVSGIPLGLAVRYHFWYFQVKERRLGCRLRDWFKKEILGRN